MTTASTTLRRPGASDSGRWVPYALVALAVIPVVAGGLRLVEVFGGPHTLPANPRISASPLPVVVHIVSAGLYAVLGAVQFSARSRRRHLRWHRLSGRLVVVLGLAVALSALWMMAFTSRPQDTGALLPVRFAFGAALAVSLALGVRAIRRGDVRRHEAWMTRAYAVALGAGTQVFTLGLGRPLLGSGELVHALLLVAAWCINLSVAEAVLRRRRRPAGRVAPAAGLPGRRSG